MQCSAWIKQLTTLKYDYKVIHGGRSSGKTVGASQGVVLLSVQSKINILCGRQFLNSIADSIKSDIEQVIAENNLNSFFTITDKDITGANGSYITFAGFDRNVESIKGKTKFDYTVIDEAQTLSRKTLDILTPTIRKDGSQIWFILNRTNISDPVDYDFIQNTPDNCWVKYLTYEDNPFHGEKAERERVRFLSTHPEKYNHVWLGHHDLNADNLLVNMDLVVKSTQNEIRYDEHRPLIMGVDPARLGGDRFAICLRRGRTVTGFKILAKMDTNQSSNALYDFIKKTNPKRVFIDTGGLGVGVYDNLKSFGIQGVKGVNFGASAFNQEDYVLRRDEMYGEAKKWFEEHETSIFSDDNLKNQLITELSTITKGWDSRSRLRLPSKDTYAKKGFNSPDLADSFVLTFAEPVANDTLHNNNLMYNKPRLAHGVGYIGL